MQKFYKGRTNNHLTWVMVDATDFATPESALSAATTIKIYGKTRGATTTALVSSGTGSLTNDITHVGASALGIYTIALVKADLSDASAAWYDQYIIALSGTGAARQVLVVDGGIDDSNLSAIVSDITSALALANSRILVIQSAASQTDSVLSSLNSEFLSRVPKAVATASFLSDAHSDLRSFLVVMSGAVSDIYSNLSNAHSDIISALGNVSVTITASDISDIASAVVAALPITSVVSDIYSLLSSLNSEFLSRVPEEVAARSQVSDLSSDIRSVLIVNQSAVSDIYSLLSNLQSGLADASDIASAVWEHAIGARVDSRILLLQSAVSDVYSNLSNAHSDLRSQIGGITFDASVVSDIYSLLSSLNSEFLSRVPKETAARSQLSDLASDLRSFAVVQSSVESNIYSLLSDLQSDFQSRVPKAVATNSQLSDLHSDLKSHLAVTSAVISDVYSLLSDAHSDLKSAIGGIAIDPSGLSDIYSLLSDLHSDVTAGVTIGASSLSDIASVIQAAATTTPIPANIKMINDVSLTGDGTLGNEWGP